jgi:hypothetical protein
VKCPLCSQSIKPYQSCIRIIVEEVQRDDTEDGTDPIYWSQIEDWDAIALMHSECVKCSLIEGRSFPYVDEVSKLKLSNCVESPPRLKLVQGDKL